MGGVIIIMGIVVPVLLVADLKNVYVLIMLMGYNLDGHHRLFGRLYQGLQKEQRGP